MGSLPLIPVFGNVEVAVAAAIFLDIWSPIDAGADDVLVPFTLTGGKPAWAGHIPITFLILQKPVEKL